MPIYTGNYEGVKIFAFDFETGKKVGEYDNARQASRKLFIKSYQTIYSYINGANKKTFKGKKRGVKSYKGGVYHFEVIK